MLDTIKAVKNIGQLVKLAEQNATMLTFYADGGFDAYFDNVALDQRIVVHYHGGHAIARCVVLGGYNAERHEWSKETAQFTLSFDNRRGVGAINEAYKRLALALKGFYPRILSLYRRNGAWSC